MLGVEEEMDSRNETIDGDHRKHDVASQREVADDKGDDGEDGVYSEGASDDAAAAAEAFERNGDGKMFVA